MSSLQEKTIKKIEKYFALYLSFIIACCIFGDYGKEKDSNNEQNQPSKKEYVTFADFESVEMGMTYKEVVELIGMEGKLDSESSYQDVELKYYIWEGEGLSNMVVGFFNDKAETKTQLGLK